MSYVRDRTTSVSIRYRNVNLTITGANVTTLLSSSQFPLKVFRVLTGNLNPQWRKQVLAHQCATTNMTATTETLESVSAAGTRTTEQSQGPVLPPIINIITSSGDVAGNRYLPTSDNHANPELGVTDAQNQCMSKAFKKLRDAQATFSGGTFIGELGEAIHMIRHPAESLRKALRTGYLDPLSKRKKSSPKNWKKTISQTWLEGCFGWRPLIHDLEDAVKAYEAIRDRKEDSYVRIRAVVKKEQLVSQISYDSFPTTTDFQWLGSRRVFDEALCVIRGEVKNRAITTAADKARIFGLTPEEFLPTAWELLPWSFLADYFANIGDIIAAGATDTSSVSWLQTTLVRSRIYRFEAHVDVPYNKFLKGSTFRSCDGRPGFGEFKRKLVQRNPLPGLTVPPLEFKLPGGSIQQLNMLALFTQANSINPQDTRKLRGRTFR